MFLSEGRREGRPGSPIEPAHVRSLSSGEERGDRSFAMCFGGGDHKRVVIENVAIAGVIQEMVETAQIRGWDLDVR